MCERVKEGGREKRGRVRYVKLTMNFYTRGLEKVREY